MPDQMQQSLSTALPMMAMDDIPTPKADAKKIVALDKKGGRVTGYQLEDGRVLDKQEAVQLAREGGIRGVGIAHRKDTQYLKSLPDNTDDNNLSHLPTVSH